MKNQYPPERLKDQERLTVLQRNPNVSEKRYQWALGAYLKKWFHLDIAARNADKEAARREGFNVN